jgi:hypothetical protein
MDTKVTLEAWHRLFKKETPGRRGVLLRCFYETPRSGRPVYVREDVADMATFLQKVIKGADKDIADAVLSACKVAKGLRGVTVRQDIACGLLLAQVGRFLIRLLECKGDAT